MRIGRSVFRSPWQSGTGQDGILDGARIRQNLVIPEPDDRISLSAQPSIAHSVTQTFGMLRAVGFDDQPMLEADEIDDVSTQRNLAAKLQGGQPAATQKLPQPTLGVCRRLAHAFGKITLLLLQLGRSDEQFSGKNMQFRAMINGAKDFRKRGEYAGRSPFFPEGLCHSNGFMRASHKTPSTLVATR